VSTGATRPGRGDPEVLLDVVCEQGLLYLVLANDGPATAFEVSVVFAHPLLGVGGEVDIAASRLFRRLPLLRAGHEVRVFIDTSRELQARRQRKIVRATVHYRDRRGRRFQETVRHDLRIWGDFGEIARG
jgi:hypothetical protein